MFSAGAFSVAIAGRAALAGTTRLAQPGPWPSITPEPCWPGRGSIFGHLVAYAHFYLYGSGSLEHSVDDQMQVCTVSWPGGHG